MVASAKSSRSHTPRKPFSANHAKKPVKPNASILSFFKKAERQEASLFVGVNPETSGQTSGHDEDLYNDDIERYNEIESPIKKRRISEDGTLISSKIKTSTSGAHAPQETPDVHDEATGNEVPKKPKHRIFTPFAMDSDSEDDEEPRSNQATIAAAKSNDVKLPESPLQAKTPIIEDTMRTPPIKSETAVLKHEESTYAQFDQIDELEDDLGLLEDESFEGEEMREMKYMREQARLEAEEAGGLNGEEAVEDAIDDGSQIACCPICESSLVGISVELANRHINSCLDGDPLPIPQQPAESPEEPPKVEITEISKRFARAAVPRPAQPNPLDVDGPKDAPRSAFSKLMANNAEDSAWAVAAAEANASRGRPAYQRTCPFYKIMPGFSICVDAFRYGAVEGCKAYFLSHFHSDHYIGLTSNWCHGPIYCSKVTGSLVKQQLRTAAKWVVEIEFDKAYDIPETGGASVTMIPANHCPGSSLFLFEKPQGAGPNSRPKRILHCGDFRACPEHVAHPLLRPDIKDSLSGKIKQQKIDICYLDTTYLNPRYSFPPQEDVIKACADLCASTSADPDCKDDIWEKSAPDSGTPAVSKYFSSTKADMDAASAVKAKPKQRLLVICGTYSIGKERICIAIAKALGSKIFASASKIRICKQLGDPELTSLLTSDPLEAQVHMQMLMEIRAETLQEYLNGYKPHFSRIIGFRPSGWNYRPSNGKAITANTPPSTIPTTQILHGKGWRTRFGYKDFTRQRGSTKEAMCFGVPYSEHSSFRELSMFVMSLRIEKIIPTVNVGSEPSRKRMKAWIDRWMAERRRGGLVRPLIEGQDDEQNEKLELWDGKSGKGGGAWW